MLGNTRKFEISRPASALLAGAAAAVLALAATQAQAAVDIFDGNLIVSSLTYTGNASTVTVGQNLPDCPTPSTCIKAVANGAYPNVFQNDGPDSSFGVTAPYSLQVLQTNAHSTAATVKNTIAVPDSAFSGSFSSKSEGALNLSSDGRSITFMGYASTPNQIDISNSNTPGAIDTTNPVTAPATPRTIAQVNAAGQFTFTNVNSYSGNNGRAAILADGKYYTVGNAGNGANPQPASIINSTGVQMVTPGTGASSKVGTFSITQIPGNTKPDKAGKDDNYRGETIFDNTLYVTKGSGSNGIDTVYQVGAQGGVGSLNTNSAITVLPGFPTGLAKTNSANFFPFGIWFANASTLYVADEGDGVIADAAGDPNAGLEKWSLVNGTWKLDYTLQSGLNLGQQYGVAGYPTSLDPATDGLRNITGRVNADGTVTIYAITSTVSTSGDPGADPDKLVAINDLLSATGLPTGESFSTLETAQYGQVLRGVSLAPVPEPATWAMLILGVFGLGLVLRARNGKTLAA